MDCFLLSQHALCKKQKKNVKIWSVSIALLTDTQTERQTFTRRGNLHFPAHLSFLCVDCGGKPELLEETDRNLNVPIHAQHFHLWHLSICLQETPPDWGRCFSWSLTRPYTNTSSLFQNFLWCINSIISESKALEKSGKRNGTKKKKKKISIWCCALKKC